MDRSDDGAGVSGMVCFNELSINPTCKSVAQAEQRVKDFALLMKEIRSHTEVTKVRYSGDLTSIPLTEDMTVQDYCNADMHNPLAIVLLSMFIKPQVDEEDDESLKSYLDTTVEISVGEDQRVEADGFNAAYCQGTFCVGFASESIWESDFFDISVTSNGKTKDVRWACISSPDFYSKKQEHAHRKPEFDAWLREIRPVTLLKSTKLPEKKTIYLRDDHGKDKLMAHAKSLCNNPYVESILTSLPYKPQAKSYIAKIYDDGLIDIVLYWEDKGYSMRVKTTGRNITETTRIANIIKDRYGKK